MILVVPKRVALVPNRREWGRVIKEAFGEDALRKTESPREVMVANRVVADLTGRARSDIDPKLRFRGGRTKSSDRVLLDAESQTNLVLNGTVSGDYDRILIVLEVVAEHPELHWVATRPKYLDRDGTWFTYFLLLPTGIVRPGVVGIVPSDVHHSVKALTDGKAIIVDFPVRKDFG